MSPVDVNILYDIFLSVISFDFWVGGSGQAFLLTLITAWENVRNMTAKGIRQFIKLVFNVP